MWYYALLLVLPIVYDLVSLRKAHRATLFAAPYVWLLHTFQIPISSLPTTRTAASS